MASRSDVLRTRIDLDDREANRAAERHASKVGQAAGKINKSTGSMRGGFDSLKTSMLKIGVGIAAITAAGVAIDKLAERADQVSNLDRGFNTLSQRIGTTADIFLPKLRIATHGLVDDMELMKQANNAVILGVAKSDEEFAALTETALKLGRAVGLGPTAAIKSLVTGIGRQSRMMLDNLGIIVKVEEANEVYARSLGKTVSELTDFEKKQAFFNETMRAAEMAAKDLEVATGNLSESIRIQKVRIINWTNAVLDWINKIPAALDEWDLKQAFKRGFAEMSTEELMILAAGNPLKVSQQYADAMLKYRREMAKIPPPNFTPSPSEQLQYEEAMNAIDARLKESKSRLDDARDAHAKFKASMADGSALAGFVAKVHEANKALAIMEEQFARLTSPVASTFAAPGMPTEAPTQEPAPLASLGLPELNAADYAQVLGAYEQAMGELSELKINAAQYDSEQLLAMQYAQLDAETNAQLLQWSTLYQTGIISYEEYQEALTAIEQAGVGARLKIAQMEAQRKRQIATEHLRSMSQIITALFGDSKAAVIASIIMETAANIVQAFPNAFQMAAAAALGASQLSLVENTTLRGTGGSIGAGAGGGAGARAASPAAAAPPSRNVEVTVFIEGHGFIQDPTELARQMADEIGNQMNRGGAS